MISGHRYTSPIILLAMVILPSLLTSLAATTQQEKTITFNVQDLHSIIPSEFISISSAIIHPLSYQHAKNYNLPVGLVYIASTGYFLTRAGKHDPPRFS